jgi:hypothetical protein
MFQLHEVFSIPFATAMVTLSDGTSDLLPLAQGRANVPARSLTRKCHAAIAARGATAFGHSAEPMAFVPSLQPRKNARPWKPDSPGAVACNQILR